MHIGLSTSLLCRAKWIKVHGTMYKRPCALVVGIQDDGVFPQFGQLQEILVINGDVYFHVQLYSTVKYSEHYHAHAIVTKIEYLTIGHTQLLSHIPLYIRSVTGFTGPGEKALILKHHISTP